MSYAKTGTRPGIGVPGARPATAGSTEDDGAVLAIARAVSPMPPHNFWPALIGPEQVTRTISLPFVAYAARNFSSGWSPGVAALVRYRVQPSGYSVVLAILSPGALAESVRSSFMRAFTIVSMEDPGTTSMICATA